MNEIQKENLKTIVAGIESGEARLIKNRYFAYPDFCCPVGYMTRKAGRFGVSVEKSIFSIKSDLAITEFPEEIKSALSETYGLTVLELAQLQEINDGSREWEQRNKVLAFLKEKIGA